MAQIKNVQLSATKATGGGNNYDIELSYTAQFAEFEVNAGNFSFRDGFVLWEDDPVNNDQLTGVVARSVFNPNSLTVGRTLRYRINANILNTEAGKEELFGVVRLRNLALNLLYTKKSPKLKLPV